jgi:hypothetical protein
LPPISCNLILPPIDEIVVRQFDANATIADAIHEGQRILSVASELYICDSDSVGSSTTNETEQCGPAV